MGASVSQMNECECCTTTHAGVAALAYQDETRVSAVLTDLETAAIEEPLRATLRMLRNLTREHAVDADDMRALLAAGVSRGEIEKIVVHVDLFVLSDTAFGKAVRKRRIEIRTERSLFSNLFLGRHVLPPRVVRLSVRPGARI